MKTTLANQLPGINLANGGSFACSTDILSVFLSKRISEYLTEASKRTQTRCLRYMGCSRKGFVHRLLGKIKITEQADQSCQDSSRPHAIKGVEQFAYLLGGKLGHDDDRSKPATPNQFGKRRIWR